MLRELLGDAVQMLHALGIAVALSALEAIQAAIQAGAPTLDEIMDPETGLAALVVFAVVRVAGFAFSRLYEFLQGLQPEPQP